MVAKPASHAADVPRCAGLGVQDERAVERFDRGVDRAGAGARDAEILERVGAGERSRRGREQIDRALERLKVRRE